MKWFASHIILFAFFIITFPLRALGADVITSVTADPARTILEQSDYRFYVNVDALNPATPYEDENTAMDTPSAGTVVRLRLNAGASSLPLTTGHTFVLQYATSTSGTWTDVGTSTAWVFGDNASIADGQVIVTPLLASSDEGETYNESSPTDGTPNEISVGQEGEWDWVIENSSASTESDWFFRMIFSSSTAFDSYANYPKFSGFTSGGGGGSSSTPPSVQVPPPPFPRYHAPPPAPISILACSDFNGDNRVDMIDFSIFLFYFEKEGTEVNRFDCNNDGVINLSDISILLFYWTVAALPFSDRRFVMNEEAKTV